MSAALGFGGMASGTSQGSGRTGRPAGVFAVASGPGETPSASAITTAAAELGIPEAEFTPRVKDAVFSLLGDVERLTREIEQMQTRLADAAKSADQDMLLPILNRRAFMREVARFISFAERYGTPSSLLYFDLDRFKAVNDVYGHEAGDVVLRHFSDLMARQIRESDVLARLGGDEFGVILAHVTLDQAKRKGVKLAEALRDHPPMWKGATVPLSFSLGAYELRAGENADAAMSQADLAMYVQKRARR